MTYRLGICRSILLSYGTAEATHNRFGRLRQPFWRGRRPENQDLAAAANRSGGQRGFGQPHPVAHAVRDERRR